MKNPAGDIHLDHDSPIPPPAPDSFHNTTALPGPDSTANATPQAGPTPKTNPTAGSNPMPQSNAATTPPRASPAATPSGAPPTPKASPTQKIIHPLYENQIIQPSAIDRATYQDIAKNSPTAKALLDYAQANGYRFYVVPSGGVAKDTREADAKATGYPSIGEVYMDSLGNQPSDDWARKTSPFHELVHFLQHDIHDKIKTVPPELRSMMDAIRYPYPVGPGHYQPGNAADFEARRVQNNIIREYTRNVHHREPDPQRNEVLDSFGREALPEGTLYGRPYPLPGTSKQTSPAPAAPTPASTHP